MQLSVEISMYPLKEDYIPSIQGFIDRVNSREGIKVITNVMSTQIFGDYDLVMDLIRDEIRLSYEQHGCAIFVCKFIEGNLDQA
jgi:uncharacterized protein YqgV (UPF0045/DUF77 family)